MQKYSQKGRPLSVATPLGEDAVLLNGFRGEEALSRPYSYELDLLAPASAPVPFARLLGQPVTVSMALPEDEVRTLHGIVVQLTQGPRVPGAHGDATFVRYRAVVAPKLWLLSRRSQSRIFQQMTVPQILKAVLDGIDLDDRLQGDYEPRDYCVQYRESDLAFASRLMEEEGIYYYFRHSAGSHRMVLGDTPGAHADVPGPTTVAFDAEQGGVKPDDRVSHWEKTQEIRSGKYTLWDHCFELPGQNLEASQPTLDEVRVGTVGHSLKVGGNEALEVYDYPGGYAQRFDGVAPGGGDQASKIQKIFDDNKRTVGIRMQQEAVPSLRVSGRGNVRHLAAGHKFKLEGHFDANGGYVLTRVRQEAGLGGAYLQVGGPSGEAFTYESEFDCIPESLPYRPARVTPRPRVDGMQTAVVVGPQGQEIFTDKYGRVKVQFPWDRQGKKDAGSSCWVRVSSTWAGKQWGFIQIPRIGQEVVVAFEEGDPDRPLITGSVYNAEQMPPYPLPDDMTQSGTKSRSTTQAGAENFNQLRFEDKKGSELVYFHAEKDFARVVENDDSLKVGFEKKDKGDQSIEVFNNQTVKVGAGEGNAADGSQTVTVYKDRSTTIKTGDETLTVEKGKRTVNVDTGDDAHNVKTGNRSVVVSTGNDSHQIKTGNREVAIDMGNDTLTIKMGNQTTKLNLGASTTEAMQKITLKVGPSSIELTPMGVTIKGMTVAVEGTVQAQVKGVICQVNGDAMLKMQGGITMIN